MLMDIFVLTNAGRRNYKKSIIIYRWGSVGNKIYTESPDILYTVNPCFNEN